MNNQLAKGKLPIDHRVEVAARKRALTRTRILDATIKVIASAGRQLPVIEDVGREAGVSRGSFYLHFQSLEEALQAVSELQSDQFTRDILPVYDLLKEPWQRFSVGFRVFLKRAEADPIWASFVTRSHAISAQLLVGAYMREDLQRGLAIGQFNFGDIEVAVDFMLGASAAGIYALGAGVADPKAYMDESVRMGLVGLGCSASLREKAVKFSHTYLDGWKMGNVFDAASQKR
jgi:AcrR family transcriptional regulator